MKILVINSGSSSLKFQVIDSDSERVLARGVCERIGIDGVFSYKTDAGLSLVLQFRCQKIPAMPINKGLQGFIFMLCSMTSVSYF